MANIITRVFDYLGSGGWSTEEIEVGGGGGLPTGWTQEGDPANVDTHDGTIVFGIGSVQGTDGADQTAQYGYQGWQAANSDTGEAYAAGLGNGFQAAAPTGVPAFSAFGAAGGTVALDAGGLDIVSDNGAGSVATVNPGSADFTAPADNTVNPGHAAVSAAEGIVSQPSGQTTAFEARGEGGATVALNAGGLTVTNFATLDPTSPPVVPLTAPTVQDVIDALVTLGLVTQSD